MAETSTILIVNKGQQTKSYRVKTMHLKFLRYYLMAGGLIIAVLAVSVIRLSRENDLQRQRQQQLTRQLSAVKKLIPPPEDTSAKSKVELYIDGIESKLKKINKFLVNRGIKGFTVSNAGGGDSAPPPDETELYEQYYNYIGGVLSAVTFVPMGYPGVYPVSSRFGYRRDPFSRERLDFHPGIDLLGRRGEKVHSTAAGTVASAGWVRGYGNCVRIRHGMGFETLYGHLSKIYVKRGQHISPGQIVGAVGSTGHSTGNHLHYEIRKNGKVINPMKYMAVK